MTIRARAIAPTALLAAVLLSACPIVGGYIASSPAIAGDPIAIGPVVPDEPGIAVEPVTRVLLLKADAGAALTRAEAQRLVDFLGAASEGRLDAIHVVVVGRHPAPRRAVLGAVRRLGVAPDNVRELDKPANDRRGFAVRVVATRYVAHPQDCPPLDIRGPSRDDNDFESTLGCSSYANLAATVNDPRDLLGNEAVPPADGGRAAAAVRRLNSGSSATILPLSGSGSSTSSGSTTTASPTTTAPAATAAGAR